MDHAKSSWNPEFWINLVALGAPIAKYFLSTLDTSSNRIPATAQIDSLIKGIQTLIATPISNNSGICDHKELDNVLLSGSKTVSLFPNNPVHVGIFSSYYLRTRGYGCWRAEAGIASDYYLLGVVESQLTHDPNCCSDKYANYVVGAKSSSVNDNALFTLNSVNSIGNRLGQVGFIMSSFGSWNGFTPLPGTGIIPLTREFDNDLSGPSCITDEGNPHMLQKSPFGNISTISNIRVYPTIITGLFNVDINSDVTNPVQIELMDIRGNIVKRYYNGDMENGTHSLQFAVDGISAGNYLLRCQVGGQNQVFKLSIL